MRLIAPETVRWPADERLGELAEAQPCGWWKDHADRSDCCKSGVPGCDLGQALARLHERELRRRA